MPAESEDSPLAHENVSALRAADGSAPVGAAGAWECAPTGESAQEQDAGAPETAADTSNSARSTNADSSLAITSLQLVDFRGYSHFELDGLGRLTIVAGPNAVGKTNIVEGIQLLTGAASFRKPSWADTVSWGRDAARLRTRFEGGKRSVEHVLTISGGKRIYEVNGKRKGAPDVRGTLPCVLFIPDDLQLVKASSAMRRDCLDALACQLSKSYAAIKAEYAKTVRQRNLLIREDLTAGPLFESWNESLVVHGSRLTSNRYRLFARLAAHMQRIYAEIVPGEDLQARYIPSWQRFDAQGRQFGDCVSVEELDVRGGVGELCAFAAAGAMGELGAVEVEGASATAAPGESAGEDMSVDACAVRLEELVARLALVEQQRRTSLVGPQKDEVAFFINGRNARLFASQGQQRTIVLSWKLAEVELVHEIAGVKPVLLLDDVMSELDAAHREALTWFIEQSAQTLITTTNLGYFSQALLDQAKIVEVPVEGTRYSY